jgi:hypothetical protein
VLARIKNRDKSCSDDKLEDGDRTQSSKRICFGGRT